MKNFKLVCPTDQFTKVVSAPSQEEGVKMLMADAEVLQHVTTAHPEMAGKTPEEMTAAVMGMVSEVVETPAVEMPAAPAGEPTPEPEQPKV